MNRRCTRCTGRCNGTCTGQVFLVGAGPGDPKLLTVRALELLRAAQVVAYDKLVPAAILDCAHPDAIRVCVGRRHGAGVTGFRLHPEVLSHALAGRSVVRLKCGDPMIFGRGGEEAAELAAAGIAYEIIPGVCSALGAAASTGIPLTHRLLASDVTWVTGHDADGVHHSHATWSVLGRGTGTIVLFMVARHLPENLARLIAYGRAADTPAAYVAHATHPDQQVVIGTLACLARRVAHISVEIPALVIVGPVVTLYRQAGDVSHPLDPITRLEAH